MKLLKSAGLALALSVLGTAAFAAEAMDCCCCKDKEAKMSCCDKMKDKTAAPKPAETKPAPSADHQEHKH